MNGDWLFIDRINMLEKPDVINGQKFWVDSVKFKVPFYRGTPKEFDTIKANRSFQPNESHDETVAHLSKLSEAKLHIEVKVDMDELDLTSAEAKATYKEIQDWVQEKYGFHVTNLNIAQVKQKHGIIERENYNKPKSESSRQPGCPEEKVKAIEEETTNDI